ncbi:hypothetical protein M011DRAFT_447913 [Sporormia fimetaria CBS 119925]|uniref:Uncharacterized protein n=1 Tax=Sporormia fimetaria CBS 119925 TaxID=1340428 RepID=A0A6A6V5U9_9PLEO|nr:hypothetical protein M011DRAFT_447913 [Sporormia fimetaria CBS 119925]
MLPPRRISSLRPCLQNRRALSVSRAQSSAQRGDRKDAQRSWAQDPEQSSVETDPQNARQAGWLRGIIQRASALYRSTPHEAPRGSHTPQEDAGPAEITDPRQGAQVPSTAELPSVETTVSHSVASGTGSEQTRVQSNVLGAQLDHPDRVDVEDPRAKTEELERVQRELRELREQVRRLQGALSSQPEPPQAPVHALVQENLPKSGPVPSSSVEMLHRIASGDQDPSLLHAFLKRTGLKLLKVNGSRLKISGDEIRTMSPSVRDSLEDIVGRAIPIFKNHLKEAFAESGTKTSGWITAEKYLDRAEADLEYAMTVLRTRGRSRVGTSDPTTLPSPIGQEEPLSGNSLSPDMTSPPAMPEVNTIVLAPRRVSTDQELIHPLKIAKVVIRANANRMVTINWQIREIALPTPSPLISSANKAVRLHMKHFREHCRRDGRLGPKSKPSKLVPNSKQLRDDEAYLATYFLRLKSERQRDAVSSVGVPKRPEIGPHTIGASASSSILDTQQLTQSRNPTSKATSLSSQPSLLEELFPEASLSNDTVTESRTLPSKLQLPQDKPLIRPTKSLDPFKAQLENSKPGAKQQSIKPRTKEESLTVLQLSNCSTELTEADFKRLIPTGKHIEAWVRDGEFSKVIPGRDPLTLERLPFYFLVFKSPESALAYQRNAARLHKLTGLHQPSSIFSAIPPPAGFLEDGEDLQKVLSTYFLRPTSLPLDLRMLPQPYNPTLRDLFDRGGYTPIVPSVSSAGTPIYKVLLHIEGWEPLRDDLYTAFKQHAASNGLRWEFRNGVNGIERLRNVANLKTWSQAVSTLNPRAVNPERVTAAALAASGTAAGREQGGDALDDSADRDLKQTIVNRLYNRWIVEFEDEGAARRFARMWHRRVLPAAKVTWKDVEEPRMVNAEFLW